MAKKLPPDQDQREQILHDLDSNILVEAAAGTGKTTSMVGRMLELLSGGKCDISTLAAVTFTKKAAAELRGRFQVALEERVRETDDEQERARLNKALAHLSQCFIGTIHSFCGRILRERPIEARVDASFEEIDDDADQLLREEAWNSYIASLYAASDPALDELHEVDLEAGVLRDAFLRFAEYPDVDEWPSDFKHSLEREPLVNQLKQYVRHIEALLPELPRDTGTDKLMPMYRKLRRLVALSPLDSLASVIGILEQCGESKATLMYWPNTDLAKKERDLWNAFGGEVVEPALAQWRQHRYTIVMRVLHGARSVYDELREARGQLNFQDLLMKTSELLADKPDVRSYFRKRFTHLLIDEFQDTDPVQAKVMMYLTADDDTETDWTRCHPRPGSLFVVGDPKQSIYRFRRADIATYNQVKQIIQESGGKILTLSANFRTSPQIIDWVNDLFDKRFPQDADEFSPAYVSLDKGREDSVPGSFHSVLRLTVPKDAKPFVDYESEAIAAIIHDALHSERTVTRSTFDAERGKSTVAEPGDFMIVTRKRKHMSTYAQALGRRGIPHQVTGGTALNETRQIRLLLDCLKTVFNADNPVPLVNLLRGELFGFSDQALYRFKKAGGQFKFRTSLPDGLSEQDRASFKDAFRRLQQYATWFNTRPPLAALEKLIADLGILPMAASEQGGDIQAGNLMKVFEILRNLQGTAWSPAELLTGLEAIVERDLKYDGLAAGKSKDSVVRIMNLHKVKGLEAPVVFLADSNSPKTYPPSIHIDRSGGKTLGYIAISKKLGEYQTVILAHPEHWEQIQLEEQKFLDAEENRLLYVAATRAGSQLAFVDAVGSTRNHAWKPFCDAAEDLPAVQVPGHVTPPVATESTQMSTKDIQAAIARVNSQWSTILQPTYVLRAAKSLAAIEVSPLEDTSGYGPAWGTVIHKLLETAMRHPQHDLSPLTNDLLAEHALPSDLCEEALAIVKAVSQSAIWHRAHGSNSVLVETPFQYQVDDELVRGVVDLAFKEDEQWILVDYKTDAAARHDAPALVEMYRPQLEHYAQAWQTFTGAPPKEMGFYFTAIDDYITLAF